MRSNLRRGCLIPPRDLPTGIQRLGQLRLEISRIEGHLADENRCKDTDWVRRANEAAKLFREEEKQLSVWVSARKDNAEALLKRAYDVLKTLEKEVDLEEEETVLIGDLDTFFGTREKKVDSACPVV